MDLYPAEELPVEAREVLSKHGVDTVPHKVTLGYNYWNASMFVASSMPR